MPYGLPCPDMPMPGEVYDLTEQVDKALAEVAVALAAELQRLKSESSAALTPSVQALQGWVRKQLADLNRIIGEVVAALQMALTSQIATVNGTLALTITNIANELQLSAQEVMYGAVPQPYAPPPYPATTCPVAPQYPLPVTPLFPPETLPSAPAPPPAPAPGFPPSTGVATVTPGAPSQVVCAPVTVTAPVLVQGYQYAPTFSVATGTGGMVVGPDGNPVVAIRWDMQLDGSITFSIGPINVNVSLPPHPINPQAPACPLAMTPSA